LFNYCLSFPLIDQRYITKAYESIQTVRFSKLSIKHTKHYKLSKTLKDIVAEIQFKLDLSHEEIAKRIKYSRPYLTAAIKENQDGKIRAKILNEFKDILVNDPSKDEKMAGFR